MKRLSAFWQLVLVCALLVAALYALNGCVGRADRAAVDRLRGK